MSKYLPNLFAVKIVSEAHSRAVQDRLFQLGCFWGCSRSKECHVYTEAFGGTKEIQVGVSDDIGRLTHSSLSNNGRYGPYITLDELFEYTDIAPTSTVVNLRSVTGYAHVCTITDKHVAMDGVSLSTDSFQTIINAFNKHHDRND